MGPSQTHHKSVHLSAPLLCWGQLRVPDATLPLDDPRAARCPPRPRQPPCPCRSTGRRIVRNIFCSIRNAPASQNTPPTTDDKPAGLGWRLRLRRRVPLAASDWVTRAHVPCDGLSGGVARVRAHGLRQSSGQSRTGSADARGRIRVSAIPGPPRATSEWMDLCGIRCGCRHPTPSRSRCRCRSPFVLFPAERSTATSARVQR